MMLAELLQNTQSLRIVEEDTSIILELLINFDLFQTGENFTAHTKTGIMVPFLLHMPTT